MLRECGIDARQIEQVLDIVPGDYIRANVAHTRRRYANTKPGGGAFFKCLCLDWCGWIPAHAERWREQRAAAAAIEAKPDPYAELAIITDDEWPAIVREAIEAIEDQDRRTALLAGIAQHGTPRQSDTLKDIVLAHVRRCAVAADAGEIVTNTYRRGIDAAGAFYTAVA